MEYPAVSGFTSKIISNKLRQSVASAISSGSTDSIMSVSGDFDIQTDFTLVTYPASDIWLVRLTAAAVDDLTDFLYIDRRYASGHKFVAQAQIDSVAKGTAGSVTTTLNTGKLRLTRAGTTVTCYYWDGSAWANLYSYIGWVTGPVKLSLAMRTTAAISAAADFDNFKINSGTVVWPGDVPIKTYTDTGLTAFDASAIFDDLIGVESQFVYADSDPISHWTMDNISGSDLG